MTSTTKISLAIIILVMLVALLVVMDRGGLIASATMLAGAGLVAKAWLHPSNRAPAFAISLAIVPVLLSVGAYYYVISSWESGEVVELAFETEEGPHTARLWVMDVGSSPTVYYDAPPEAAKALLAGAPVQFTRNNVTSTRTPQARPVEALPEEEANLILEAMLTKYGDLNGVATVNYLLLGRPTDQVALVVNLIES